MNEITQNSVTINDPEDHVFYRDLKMGDMFMWIEADKSVCPIPCMKIDTGYIWLDIGMSDRWEGVDDETGRSRCKPIKSVTIESI